jgi:hypothetical protein
MALFRRLALVLVVVLVVAACDATTSDTTLRGNQASTTVSDSDGSTTTTTPEPITELPGTEDLPQDVQDELLELVNLTQELRQLSFLEPPLISIVTEAELEARVRAQIEEEAEDFPVDEALYKLLGLLSPTADLATLLIELYGEQVAGFYDGDTGELVVPIRDDGFSPVQKATMVHELTHSLTDQNFDFHTGYQAMFDEQRYDEAAAYQALIEGDASLNEVLYLQTLSQTELGEFFAEALQVGTGQLDAAPRFIQETLIFPYDTGLAFVQDLYLTSGWGRVDEAYNLFVGLPVLLAGFLVLQLVPYGRDHSNPPVIAEPLWDSPDTRELSVRACFDCHSNETEWAWYSNVAPLSWLIQSHVDEGREELNFSESQLDQEGEEAAETVRDGSMPYP